MLAYLILFLVPTHTNKMVPPNASIATLLRWVLPSLQMLLCP
jgi:hypothetical protein